MDNYTLVKERLSITSLAGHYSAVMKGRFANPAPCCNNNDCCDISTEKNLFRCYSCRAEGSVIDMVMAAERCDEAEALRKCAGLAGVQLKNSSGEAVEEKRPAEGIQARMYRIAAEFYEEAMTNKCAGWEYFIGKRGHKESTMEKLRAGFATGKLLKHLVKHGFNPSEIVKYGLATDTIKVEEDGKKVEKTVPPFDYYGKGLVVFPVVDHAGKVISFTAKDPEKKRDNSFMRGAVKKWFINYPALFKPSSELFIVEGENDVASLMDAGFDNVLGTAGAPAKEQITLLKNCCNGKTLYLWFDKDPNKDPRKNDGGARHTRFIYEGLRGHNIDVRVIVHPGEAKDPDEFIQAHIKAQTAGGCAA